MHTDINSIMFCFLMDLKFGTQSQLNSNAFDLFNCSSFFTVITLYTDFTLLN